MPTKRDKVLSTLQKVGSSGIPMQDLMREGSVILRDLYGIIYLLRKKGHKIDLVDGKYFYKGLGSKPANIRAYKRRAPVEPRESSPSKLFNKEVDLTRILARKNVLSEVKTFSNEEKTSFFEMVGKSIFYRLCAEAFISSRKAVEEIQQEVLNA